MSALDPTFRSYSSQQAAQYSSHRGSYSGSLYDHITHHHNTVGNSKFDTLLDVGCGTGSVTRNLAVHFDRAIGVDPSPEMVLQAERVGGTTKSGKTIDYEVVGAEELEKASTIEPGSVDLISSGMAAHWFHMSQFWPQAAKMLKPGGTVALWTHSSLYCHPSTPNAVEVQRILSHLEDDILGHFELPSNHLSRTMYDNLTMPWDFKSSVPSFAKDPFSRLEWNRDGQLEPGKTDFFGGSDETTLQELEASLGTASMVTRWRQAYPDLAGTDEDCVKVTVRKIAEAMNVKKDDLRDIRLRVASSTALLLLTKDDNVASRGR